MLKNKRAFTIIEVLISAIIGAFMVTALLYILIGGLNVNDLSSAKVAAQAQARRVSDWLSGDLRQAVLWDLANNSPSPTHLKFRPVLGRDDGGYRFKDEGVNYIKYNYDSGSKRLTRSIVTEDDVLANTAPKPNSWVFNDIAALSFSTRDNLRNPIVLDSNSVRENKRIVTLISVNKVSSKGVSLTVSLTTETKIRNE